jgi:hypothetical protein
MNLKPRRAVGEDRLGERVREGLSKKQVILESEALCPSFPRDERVG